MFYLNCSNARTFCLNLRSPHVAMIQVDCKSTTVMLCLQLQGQQVLPCARLAGSGLPYMLLTTAQCACAYWKLEGLHSAWPCISLLLPDSIAIQPELVCLKRAAGCTWLCSAPCLLPLCVQSSHTGTAEPQHLSWMVCHTCWAFCCAHETIFVLSFTLLGPLGC